MGGTRITTPTNPWVAPLALLGAMLACLAFVNLDGRVLPSTKLNNRIIEELARAAFLPAGDRLQLLGRLREQQEKTLVNDPAEPFGWGRLAWLRLVTQGDKTDAFAALRLSNLVSPDEPRQLPERALMWRQLASVEDENQKAYQNTLWQKAFQMQRDATWTLAAQNKITDEVGETLKQTDNDLYEEWKARENSQGEKP